VVREVIDLRYLVIDDLFFVDFAPLQVHAEVLARGGIAVPFVPLRELEGVEAGQVAGDEVEVQRSLASGRDVAMGWLAV
jgi:hypothetical protein